MRPFGFCDGAGVKVYSIGLDERGKVHDGTKEYRCHRCGRWLRINAREELPAHKKPGLIARLNKGDE